MALVPGPPPFSENCGKMQASQDLLKCHLSHLIEERVPWLLETYHQTEGNLCIPTLLHAHRHLKAKLLPGYTERILEGHKKN